MIFSKSNSLAVVLSAAVIFSGGVIIAYGSWYYTGNQPTAGNLGVPIDTTSFSSQDKAGGLKVNTDGASVGLIVSDDRSKTWDSYYTGIVGIGTNSPFEKLDLKGNLKISGLIMPFGNYGSDDQVLSGIARYNDPQLGALPRFDWQDRKRWMTLTGEPGIIPCSGSACQPGTCSGSQNKWPSQCEDLGWNTYTQLCLPETVSAVPNGNNYYETRIHVCYQ